MLKKNNPGCTTSGCQCACTSCTEGNLFSTWSDIAATMTGQPNSLDTGRDIIGSCGWERLFRCLCDEDTIANMNWTNYPNIFMTGSYYLTRTLGTIDTLCDGSSLSGWRPLRDDAAIRAQMTQTCSGGVLSYSYEMVLSYGFQYYGPTADIPWYSDLIAPDASGDWSVTSDGFTWSWSDGGVVSPGDQQTILSRFPAGGQIAGRDNTFRYTIAARYAESGLASAADIPSYYTFNPRHNMLSITGDLTLS